jgi:hypothetical protein
MHPTHMRALRRAVEIAGGTASLAARLRLPPLLLAAWIEGTNEMPTAVFLLIVETIVEWQCARPGGATETAEAEAFRYREAANS